MTNSPQVEKYWQDFLATLPDDEPQPTEYEAWGFGDSPEMADGLGDLVVRGIKHATASLAWEYEADGDPIPQAGDYSVILDGQDNPICIIQTTDIQIKPFNEVDPEFAAAEGEGDRSLRYWREAHWEFFSRSCKRIGKPIDENMPVVCERFKVVYPVP